MRRALNALLVAVFVAIIALPLGANLAGQDGADPGAENRVMAPWPVLDGSWASIRDFGSGLAAWFEDHFGFRSTLVRWYALSRYDGLGVSPSNLVILGKNGWLFYAEDGGLDDYTNSKPFTDAELDNWRKTIIRERDWCNARGITYVFTSPPDKSAIYPENFPDTIQRTSEVTRLDQLMTATLDTGVMVDVRQAILGGKQRERLYHVTDTHWNQRGAFLAYQQIIEAIRQREPRVPPAWSREDFEDATRQLPGQDLAGMLGLKRVLHEEDLRLMPVRKRRYVVVEPHGGFATSGEPRIVTEIPGSDLPRAVMFRDSFTSWLAPFLSEHFSRIVYLWQPDFIAEDIEKEHPDVVIHEFVTRHLYTWTPSPEIIPAP